MDFTKEQDIFYNECLRFLESKHGESKYYLPMLKRFVMVTFKAEELLQKIMDKAVVVQHTNKANHTNSASDPEARMFALFNEQAHKLAVDLGLNLAQAKPGRKPKTAKDRFASKTMKIA